MAIRFEGEDDEYKSITCYCEGHCPSGEQYGTCQTRPGGRCFTSVEIKYFDDGTSETVLSYGCLPPNGMAQFQCRGKMLSALQNKIMKCCDQYDHCNKHLLPVLQNHNDSSNNYWDGMTFKVLAGSLTISFVVLIVVLLTMYIKYKKKEKNLQQAGPEEPNRTIKIPNNLVENNIVDISKDFTQQNKIDERSNSKSTLDNSTSGLVQRTVSKQIQMDLLIASGKYSEVWRGKWRDENVSVKIYPQKYEHKWLWETEIYESVLMRHENILGYIAADIIGAGLTTQMYIITQYHELGTLHNYLKKHPLNVKQLVKLVQSLSRGLSYLHIEVFGCKGKPSIAHNNINSKTILVKRDKECCIGDFTKAVKFISTQNKLEAPIDIYNCEPRYLAPEILDRNFDQRNFECYKMSDVYSFALLMWEMLNRCEFQGTIQKTKYKWPYEDKIELGEQNWSKVLDVVKQERPENAGI
ncbi:hypothetical protein GWI33_004159 [Rhynchophorus ferrugineus]|uniref:receptor protein serine/threonine kinase n=1 Tax=Rhynchophorus ferrugineus TaxID=354439 RepID=A0A834LWQ8_RHYFE|nr:hypothetical protein GWI33_004159 [Rhynchophorus ferrugineus]